MDSHDLRLASDCFWWYTSKSIIAVCNILYDIQSLYDTVYVDQLWDREQMVILSFKILSGFMSRIKKRCTKNSVGAADGKTDVDGF